MKQKPTAQILHLVRQEGRLLMRNELNPKYSYHCMNHTYEVCSNVINIANELGRTKDEIDLLYTAAVYHDIGFTLDHRDHEALGAKIFMIEAAKHDLPAPETGIIRRMILATHPSTAPASVLESIIIDADLHYLCTDDYDRQTRLLRMEMEWLYGAMPLEKWQSIQRAFLRKHNFHTDQKRTGLNLKKAEMTAGRF